MVALNLQIGLVKIIRREDELQKVSSLKLHFLEVVFSHVHEGLHPLIAFAFRAILLRTATA